MAIQTAMPSLKTPTTMEAVVMNAHSNRRSNSIETALQISQNGATFFSQGRIQDAMACFRCVLSMLKAGFKTTVGQYCCSPFPSAMPIPSHNMGEVSFRADGLILQPVALSPSLLAQDDERSMVVASAVAVYNLAIAHHAASQQQTSAEDCHFYMTSALKLYTLVQSLQQQADSYHDSIMFSSSADREFSFLLESMIRIATLHNAGVLLTATGESQQAHDVFEHLYRVVFNLGVTPRDFEARHFDLNAVMARVLLELNVLKESHAAPCA